MAVVVGGVDGRGAAVWQTGSASARTWRPLGRTRSRVRSATNRNSSARSSPGSTKSPRSASAAKTSIPSPLTPRPDTTLRWAASLPPFHLVPSHRFLSAPKMRTAQPTFNDSPTACHGCHDGPAVTGFLFSNNKNIAESNHDRRQHRSNRDAIERRAEWENKRNRGIRNR